MAATEIGEDRVQIKEVLPLKAAVRTGTGSYEDVSRVLMEVFRWVLERGGKVSYYPMVLFPSQSEKGNGGMKYEVWIPIDPEIRIKGDKDISIRDMPAARVAFAHHHGSFKEVGRTYDLIFGWMKDNGREPEGNARELYLTNPLETPEDKLVTEVQVPVKKEHAGL